MLPTATSTLKPTLENVVFMIQRLTTGVNYGFNGMCSNIEAMLEENKNLKEEVTLLKQQVTVLTEEAGTLKASLDSIPSAEDSTEVAATIGLFVANLFPGRKDRPASFSWKHF
ncbi:hypothetical protein RMATCC62417_12860 [Rhizopus microsporus]|nr:hypothetical protein RMATCC62417_12860 [Rhizopus microsporus]